ncbi:STAS domain-containing protein [Nocardia sp. NPDC051463]|uniref:STAS domain-containing protein n=1 Tax=Nocardia sp. NPDC051463 TaxID=3154845 RepID=UPI0034501CA0
MGIRPTRIGIAPDRRPLADDIVVHVAGDIDLFTAGQFDAGLLQAEGLTVEGGRLLLDLREVEFLGVAGLHVLDLAYRRCARRHVGLLLLAARKAITRPITLAGLHHCLNR